MWDRITGKHSNIQRQNEIEAYEYLKRDQVEKDNLIFRQLEQRQFLQERLASLNAEQQEDTQALKQAIFQNIPDDKIQNLIVDFETDNLNHEHTFKMEM